MEFLLILLAAAFAYTLTSLRVVPQYERAVVFFLGRYKATRGPAAENNSTTIFPVPIEMLGTFFRKADDAVAAVTPAGAGRPPVPTPGVLAGPNFASGLPQARFEPAERSG